MKNEVESQKNIKVFKGYELKTFSGFVGNFKSRIDKVFSKGEKNSQDSIPTKLEHGITIVATGGKELKPTEYQYGKTKKILTQQEFEGMIVSNPFSKNLKQVAMIQCVGARNDDRHYCSRICCGEAIKNALRLKEINENIEIIIFYRDIRSYGFAEDYYTQAREKGILFIR
ncbi:MAG: hypothetical protein JRJ14_09250 [Deltaproteobacteria bacterium]|nr:hypothetical protein [Deltaproteobacteria bacterium]